VFVFEYLFSIYVRIFKVSKVETCALYWLD